MADLVVPPSVSVAAERGMAKAERARTYADTFEIVDGETFGQALTDVKAIKAEAKANRAERDEFLAPIKALQDLIKARFDPVADGLEYARRTLEAKCVAWQAEVRAAELRAAEAARALVAARAPAPEQRAAITQREEIARSADVVKGTTIRDHWICVGVVDIARVPPEYLASIVDGDKVKRAIAAGVREIPGLVIENRPIVTSR